ncbi:MAG: hypothetical protein PHH14_03880 [Candidatus Margulisbacteria bacterium]|nr:hypothetical protein [Candidatus Margulisiibacteriota bacterium]
MNGISGLGMSPARTWGISSCGWFDKWGIDFSIGEVIFSSSGNNMAEIILKGEKTNSTFSDKSLSITIQIKTKGPEDADWQVETIRLDHSLSAGANELGWGQSFTSSLYQAKDLIGKKLIIEVTVSAQDGTVISSAKTQEAVLNKIGQPLIIAR